MKWKFFSLDLAVLDILFFALSRRMKLIEARGKYALTQSIIPSSRENFLVVTCSSQVEHPAPALQTLHLHAIEKMTRKCSFFYSETCPWLWGSQMPRHISSWCRKNQDDIFFNSKKVRSNIEPCSDVLACHLGRGYNSDEKEARKCKSVFTGTLVCYVCSWWQTVKHITCKDKIF